MPVPNPFLGGGYFGGGYFGGGYFGGGGPITGDTMVTAAELTLEFPPNQVVVILTEEVPL